jgi:hypothetical protein
VHSTCSLVGDESRRDKNGYIVYELKSIEKIVQERRGRKSKQTDKAERFFALHWSNRLFGRRDHNVPECTTMRAKAIYPLLDSLITITIICVSLERRGPQSDCVAFKAYSENVTSTQDQSQIISEYLGVSSIWTSSFAFGCPHRYPLPYQTWNKCNRQGRPCNSKFPFRLLHGQYFIDAHT